jgi:GDP-4-dehydro-6-deoxy-D-mannose reductase
LTALITGVCGFVGQYLATHLLECGQHVFGTYLDQADRARMGALSRRVGLLQGDVRNPRKMGVVLRRTQPDAVYHLAAVSSVGLSLSRPVATMDVNVSGTTGLLEAIKRESPGTPVLFASSAEVYGRVRPSQVPIRETQPTAPRNPYAASKLAAEEVCHYYERTFGLRIVVARSFNHSGPGQQTGFVIPDFASQVAGIERAGGRGTLRVGNLEARRDLSDVRDIVRGYRLLLQKGTPGEVYHLGSGRAYRVGDLLQLLLNLSERPIRVEKDPHRMRPSDIPVLVGSLSKTRRATGWRAMIPIERTLSDTLEYWRRYARQA